MNCRHILVPSNMLARIQSQDNHLLQHVGGNTALLILVACNACLTQKYWVLFNQSGDCF